MKKEFIKMIDNMTNEEFIKVLEAGGCPGNYGLKENEEKCEKGGECVECWREALNIKGAKRTLKTWEMIRELTENPQKVFKREFDGLEIKIDRFSKTLSWKSGQRHISINDKWSEVKQPVTWQEAIEAWANGKSLKLLINDRTHPLVHSEFIIAQEDIEKGKWYILDEEESDNE